MFKSMNPDGVAPPFRHYVHSIEVPPNCRWLSISGQIGVAPDGTVPAVSYTHLTLPTILLV